MMNDFLFYCREALASWLDKHLLRDTDWWEKRVLNALSIHQRIEVESLGDCSLHDMDIWMLTRVILGSWNDVAVFMRSPAEAKALLDYMRDMRNGWSHVSTEPASKNDAIEDFRTIRDFLEIFDGDPRHIYEVKNYIKELEEKIRR
ncbi:MAG: hypothetical protein LUD72_02815 [Bacteroidales bacterium]|nr:hypothetical protein [Bacteroidales bacterium]